MQLKSFPKSTWIATESSISSVGTGLKGSGLAYAVDDELYLNSVISATFEPESELFALGIVYRANLAWTFNSIIFSNYDTLSKEVARDRLTLRSMTVREGIPRIIEARQIDGEVGADAIELKLESNFEKCNLEVTAGDFAANVGFDIAYHPFAGSGGILGVHGTKFRCTQFVNSPTNQLASSTPRSAVQRSLAFLCHSSDDKDRVRSIAKYLSENEIDYWLDEERIPFGAPVVGSISAGLEKSSHILPFISKSFRESSWARAEYENILNAYISAKKRTIIPIVDDDVDVEDIPVLLHDFRRVRYGNTGDWEELISELRKSV